MDHNKRGANTIDTCMLVMNVPVSVHRALIDSQSITLVLCAFACCIPVCHVSILTDLCILNNVIRYVRFEKGLAISGLPITIPSSMHHSNGTRTNAKLIHNSRVTHILVKRIVNVPNRELIFMLLQC